MSVHSASNLMVLSPATTVADGTSWLQIGKNAGYFDASSTYYPPSSTNTILRLGKNGTTGRSIGVAGTVSGPGTDYAEYEKNNGLVIEKGAIVGFKGDGTLTLTHAEAFRFGLKTTSPSFVGGDTWFTEQPPDRPTFEAPLYAGPEMPADPGQDATVEERVAFIEADRAYQQARTAYLADHDAALAEFNATMIPFWNDALAAFQARLEAARIQVDRIAYSGKVPVNVTGALPGQYIVAVAAEDGSITGQAVTDPTFAQYLKAVGRVNRILPDGRAEVAVIVH